MRARGLMDNGRRQALDELYSIALRGAAALNRERSPLTPNAAMMVPAWFIDPQHGSDTNTGTTAASPLKTWRALVAKWGTLSPLLGQETVVTFLTSQTDASDPVILYPYFVNGGFLVIQGSLTTPAVTGNLAGVVPVNFATGQELEATLPAGAAAEMLLVNTTRGAQSLVQQSAGGANWFIDQPFTIASTAVPATLSSNPLGVQVNSYANTDAIELFTLTAVDLVDLRPVIVGFAPVTFNNTLYLTNLTCFDPTGIADDFFYFGDHVNAFNVSFQKTPYYSGNDGLDEAMNFVGCGYQAGWIGGPILGTFLFMTGGHFINNFVRAALPPTVALTDNVAIFNPFLTVTIGGVFTQVFVGTGNFLAISDGDFSIGSFGGGPAPKIWGGGRLVMFGTGRLNKDPAVTWTATLLTLAATEMNGGTAASAYDSSVDPAVWHPARTINPTNLDATVAGGGFGPDGAINPGNFAMTSRNG